MATVLQISIQIVYVPGQGRVGVTPVFVSSTLKMYYHYFLFTLLT